ncbi:MAG: chalcone isomerase family protein [bacterium]
MRYANFLLIALMFFSTHGVAREIAGVELPDQVNVNSMDFQLNGAGVRKKLFIDVYAIGLYLQTPSQSEAIVAATSTTKRVLMHIVYSEVSKKKMDKGWEDGFKANQTTAEYQALESRLRDFQAMFGDMQENDVVWLDMIPGKGVEVSINGEQRGLVAGDDFIRALVRVWIGPEPVSDDLKQALLGN